MHKMQQGEIDAETATRSRTHPRTPTLGRNKTIVTRVPVGEREKGGTPPPIIARGHMKSHRLNI